MKDSGKCQHSAFYCVKSYQVGQHNVNVDLTDKDCPTNCRNSDCPLALPALCGHTRSNCSNGNCPSNCDNRFCPGMPKFHHGNLIPPPQWKFKWFIFRPIHAILCLAAFGIPNPDIVWRNMETEWDKAKGNVVGRLDNASLIAGLLLASNAAFLTTTPPTSPVIAIPLLDYTSFASYTMLVLSFATALGSLIVVGGLQFVVRSCEQSWFRSIVASSQLCVYLTTFLLAYPYLSLACSTLFFAFGLIASAWTSGNFLFRIGSVLVMLIPCSLVPIVLLLWARSIFKSYRS